MLSSNDPSAHANIAADPTRFINREMSWLAFNRRVLEEALNPRQPLFERLRFLAISASNLDEFLIVRMAGIEAQRVARGPFGNSYNLNGEQDVETINGDILRLSHDQQSAWLKLRGELAQQNIRIIEPPDLSPDEMKWLENHFHQNIFAALTPLAIDTAHPFPFIPNGSVALALQIKSNQLQTLIKVILPLPVQLDRFIRLPATESEPQAIRFVTLEDVVQYFIGRLFPTSEIHEIDRFRVLRDSEIHLNPAMSTSGDFVRIFESAVKSRYRGAIIRLAVSSSMSAEMRGFLSDKLNVSSEKITVLSGIFRLSDISQLVINERADLLHIPYEPRFPERVREFNSDYFAAISHKDIVIHHPYETFDVVVQFVRQAANDPQVVAIKQTLYRTSHNSPIVRALIEAAQAGKSVTVMVELKARFDEEANIRWARDLENAGAQVVFGFMELKTHAKISLVVRREENSLRSYAHFGTGNYHPDTARHYTDLSFFTCDADLCQDAAAVFNYTTGYAKPEAFRKIALAPLNLRQTINQLIDDEIAHVQAGRSGQIWAKMNALVDNDMIDMLYAASNAGVQIDLIVRGACCLRPGVKGLSENIRVKSIVGRFLEHSRMLAFGAGHGLPSPKSKIFISSADWMHRNLDRRIETLVPIENPTVHSQIQDQILVANFKDTRQSWELLPDGNYRRLDTTEDDFCAYEYFMKNPSLSGRGSKLNKKIQPPDLVLKKRKKN